MERMLAYFEAQEFVKQIEDKARENQSMFLKFARNLRANRLDYNTEALKNVLLLYIEAFNTLLLDYDYLYYGHIRTQYQQTEAQKFLYEDSGVLKSKASFIWLEKEGNILINKKKWRWWADQKQIL